MRHETERQHLVTVLKELKEWGVLNPAGGAVSMRLADGNILMSTTRLAFNRWHVTVNDFIVLDPDGQIIERTAALGATGTPMHLDLYRMLPRAGAIVHTHAPYSLAFASLGLPIPSVTNRADTFGEIPCLHADDQTVKAGVLDNPVPLEMPEGMVQRPDVAAVTLLHYRPQLEKLIASRAQEMERHGLGFTLYRHGAFTVGRQMEETADLMLRMEESAQTAYLQAGLTNGTVYPNRLYRPQDRMRLSTGRTATDTSPVSSDLTRRVSP
ncbi:class II aldolase/adducin family protein (plasmid) [Streptomyces sp. NBC_01527]|uniref:class II aldolase/adducin family protein n=1 Tax=Streptomyces sp. NBC_01527 TaxID=2903894 RepID=UPI002F918ECC